MASKLKRILNKEPRTVWYFAGAHVYDNGKPASETDIAAWQDWLSKLKAETNSIAEARAAEDAAWHAKYDAPMRNFFPDYYEIEDYDEERLIGALATRIFSNDGKVCNEMKRLFPEFWKEALAAFKRGDHDT